MDAVGHGCQDRSLYKIPAVHDHRVAEAQRRVAEGSSCGIAPEIFGTRSLALVIRTPIDLDDQPVADDESTSPTVWMLT